MSNQTLVTISEAASLLERKVRYIRFLRDSGKLQRGVHYFVVTSKVYTYDVDAIRAALIA
jgi:hypothetical protein